MCVGRASPRKGRPRVQISLWAQDCARQVRVIRLRSSEEELLPLKEKVGISKFPGGTNVRDVLRVIRPCSSEAEQRAFNSRAGISKFPGGTKRHPRGSCPPGSGPGKRGENRAGATSGYETGQASRRCLADDQPVENGLRGTSSIWQSVCLPNRRLRVDPVFRSRASVARSACRRLTARLMRV